MKSCEVFVSYSRRDFNLVMPLVIRLINLGVPCFIDKEDLQGSDNWRDKLVKRLRECRVVLFFVSAHSIRSKNVRKEILFASGQDKAILPVYLESVTLPDDLEYEIGHRHFLTIEDNDFETDWKRVLQSLDTLGVERVDPHADPAAQRVSLVGEWYGRWEEGDKTTLRFGHIHIQQDGEGFLGHIVIFAQHTTRLQIETSEICGAWVDGNTLEIWCLDRCLSKRKGGRFSLPGCFQFRIYGEGRSIKGFFSDGPIRGNAAFHKVPVPSQSPGKPNP